MRRLTAAVMLAVCLCAFGQASLTVEQLVSFVKSSVQLRHPDRQVAE
jgi:hypothetical protein